MADVKKTDLVKALQDAAYVAVGFGVIGFQRAQVRRQELRKQLAGRRLDLGDFQARLGELKDRVEPVVTELGKRIEPALDDLETRLPEQAKGLVQQARTRAKALLPAGTAA